MQRIFAAGGLFAVLLLLCGNSGCADVAVYAPAPGLYAPVYEPPLVSYDEYSYEDVIVGCPWGGDCYQRWAPTAGFFFVQRLPDGRFFDREHNRFWRPEEFRRPSREALRNFHPAPPRYTAPPRTNVAPQRQIYQPPQFQQRPSSPSPNQQHQVQNAPQHQQQPRPQPQHQQQQHHDPQCNQPGHPRC